MKDEDKTLEDIIRQIQEEQMRMYPEIYKKTDDEDCQK